jgi:hypothetical protein
VEGLAADDGAAAGHLGALGAFGAAAYHALEGVCAHSEEICWSWCFVKEGEI